MMSNESQRVVFKRKFISLEAKIQILDRLEAGEKVSQIAKTLHLNEATIRTIKKHEERIRAAVAMGSATSARMRARPRAPIIEKMEKLLSAWVSKLGEEQIPDGNIIKQKALEIYNHLKESEGYADNTHFVASKGWLERFKSRFSIQNMRTRNLNTQVDIEIATKYMEEFQKAVKEGGYVPDQVFNAAEAYIWWRLMPNKMFTSMGMEDGPPPTIPRDHVTLLLCSNASGDYTAKPILVHRASYPYELKDLDINMLPVYWTTEKKAELTADVFKEWFLHCFAPAVEDYLKWKNLEFKVLLVLANSPSYLQNLRHPNVEIMFLPPNISTFIQPLEQGIISIFKANYVKKSLQWISEKIDWESIGATEAWRQFSILDCMAIIDSSLKEIKPSALNACWEKLWPNSFSPECIVESVDNANDTKVELVKSEGEESFDNETTENFPELSIKKQELNFGEIGSKINRLKEEDDSTEDSSDTRNVTLINLQEGISLAEQLESYFLRIDPSVERSAKFKTELRKCLAPYYKMYEDLSRKTEQTEVSNFFKGRE